MPVVAANRRQVKYVLHGGYVMSNDGQDHYITPPDLVRLYKLKKDECLFVYNSESNVELRGYTREFIDGLKHLYPKSDGLYTLEEMKV